MQNIYTDDLDDGLDMMPVGVNTKDGKITKPKSIEMGSAEERKVLTELNHMINNVSLDYKQLAEREMNYKDVSRRDSSSLKRLEQLNKRYATSMLMTCITPLQQGISPRSLAMCMMTYNVMCAMQPNFQENSAKVLMEMKSTLKRQVEPIVDAHPILFKPMWNKVNRISDKWLNKQQKESVKNRDTEDVFYNGVITPREAAIQKFVYAEQAYADMRKRGANIDEIREQYNKAVENINIMCVNNGVSKDAIATEERYVFGLMSSHNTKYGEFFKESSGLYGVRPELDDGDVWSGTIKTADNHPYADGFTVREPWTKDQYTDVLSQYGKFIAITDIMGGTIKDNKQHNEFSTICKEYRDNVADEMIDMMVDDGVCKSRDEASEIVDRCVTSAYDDVTNAMYHKEGEDFTWVSNFMEDMININKKNPPDGASDIFKNALHTQYNLYQAYLNGNYAKRNDMQSDNVDEDSNEQSWKDAFPVFEILNDEKEVVYYAVNKDVISAADKKELKKQYGNKLWVMPSEAYMDWKTTMDAFNSSDDVQDTVSKNRDGSELNLPESLLHPELDDNSFEK